MIHELTLPMFFGLDFLFEFFEAVIALFVGIYSYKIFKMTLQKRYAYIMWAFLFMSLSFFIGAFTNYFGYSEWISSLSPWVKITTVRSLFDISYILQTVLFTSGLVTLAILTFDINGKREMSLIFFLSILTVLLSIHIYLAAHFIQLILLGYIVPYFYLNCKKTKVKTAHSVFFAFIVMFFAHISFLFAFQNPWFYLAGHILQLFSFALILFSLIGILRK